MTNLQEKIHYYLEKGLKIKTDYGIKELKYGEAINLDFVSPSWVIARIGGTAKPIMYRLDAITRPIKVEGYNDGEELFIYEVFQTITDGSNHEEDWIEHVIDFIEKPHEIDWGQCPFRFMEVLFEAHIWPFKQSLFETGEILDKEKI